jgi:hypothetical protein
MDAAISFKGAAAFSDACFAVPKSYTLLGTKQTSFDDPFDACY